MDRVIEAINVFNAFAFLLGLAISLISVATRTLRYKLAKQPVPILLPRDLTLIFGLAFPIAAVLLARLFNITGLSNNLLWVTIVGGVPVIAIWVWAVYELIIIESKAP